MHKLSKTKHGDYFLIGPYDEELLTKIKQLPTKHRRWNSTAKAWRIAPEARKMCQHIIDEHYITTGSPEIAVLLQRVSDLESKVASLERIVRSLVADLGVEVDSC